MGTSVSIAGNLSLASGPEVLSAGQCVIFSTLSEIVRLSVWYQRLAFNNQHLSGGLCRQVQFGNLYVPLLQRVFNEIDKLKSLII